MPDAPFSEIQRRRLWWRRLVERQVLTRHPVSLTRQRVGNVLLALLVAGLLWYFFTTRDEAIRRRAVAFLVDASSGEVSVDRAQFRMFGGITLYNVRLSAPFSDKLDPTAVSPEARKIFSAESVQLIHDPWRLLLGSLRVEEIVATMPTIVLAQNVDTGQRNWQLLSSQQQAARRAGKGRNRPRITLRSARVEVASIEGEAGRSARLETMDVDARPHAQVDTAYRIEVRRFTDPAERTTVLFDPGERLVTNTPFVDARTVRLQLPKPAQRLFDEIALQGEVKLSRLVYDAQTPEERDTTIELRAVRCTVPMSMLRNRTETTPDSPTDSTAPPETADSRVHMTEVAGTLHLHGRRLELNIAGSINGAPCKVLGSLENVGAPLSELGMDLRLLGERVPAPEGPIRTRLLSDAGVPRLLQQILNDYDPHGEFDIDFTFQRQTNGAGPLVFGGTLQPLGIRSRARAFPYQLDDVRGLVRFEGKQVLLENLRGRHGSAYVRISGRVDRTGWHSSVDLDIKAAAVPLDMELFEALSDRYRSVWERFNPRGLAKVSLRLRRPGSPTEFPKPRWRTSVTADLSDAKVAFTEYPYPLEDVHGRLEIEPDRMQFVGLTGHHGEASARIDGYVEFDGSGRPRVELRLETHRMRLDDTLAAAMPTEVRGAFAQFQPDGFVDLLGSVSLREPSAGVVYDLRARVYEAAIRYQHFPYWVHDVAGDIFIKPGAITVLSVTGSHGPARLSAAGAVQRLPDGFTADLTFDCRQLPLDEELYSSLPQAVRNAWDLLKPGGAINVKTALHHVSAPNGPFHRLRSEIEAVDAALCFQEFPLPLSDLRGRALVTGDRIELIALAARSVGGTIEINGQVDLSSPGRSGTLTVDAKGLAFTEELIAAAPPRIRQALRAIKPRGKFDLRLDPLRFETAADGRTRWDFAGAVRLADCTMRLGVELRNVVGTLTGAGQVLEDGSTSLEAQAALDRAELAGWPLENITARIVAERDKPTVFVQEASAGCYGGELEGFAEVHLHKDSTDYQAAITARDLQLSEYLQSTFPKKSGSQAPSSSDGRRLPPNAPPRNAQGSIYGNLVLQGRTGAGGYLEGAGELFIREAQIWKMPVVLAIFQVLNMTPDENVFHDGWLKYYLSQDTLTFQQIDLQGKALSLVGGGRMDLRSKQLEVTLLAGSPMRLRVPLLTELLQGASREVMEVRVTGTLRKPHISPHPLRSLTSALQRLFPEPPRGDRRPAPKGQP